MLCTFAESIWTLHRSVVSPQTLVFSLDLKFPWLTKTSCSVWTHAYLLAIKSIQSQNMTLTRFIFSHSPLASCATPLHPTLTKQDENKEEKTYSTDSTIETLEHNNDDPIKNKPLRSTINLQHVTEQSKYKRK